MAEVSDSRGALRQNLLDAGCSQDFIQRCLDLAQENKTAEIQRLLASHRRRLLDMVHAGQRQIDCLDYLIYSIKKNQK